MREDKHRSALAWGADRVSRVPKQGRCPHAATIDVGAPAVIAYAEAPFEAQICEGCCHGNLALTERKSEGLGSSSGRGRCLPILQRFASKDAERVAGNKMALNAERIGDGGVNRQEPLR